MNLSEGFYSGNIREILQEDQYLIFEKQASISRTIIEENRQSLICKFDFEGMNNSDPHDIQMSDVKDREDWILKNGFITNQKWYHLHGKELPDDYFRNLTSVIVKNHYPYFPFDVSFPERGNASFTLYENGNFIKNHRDGFDSDRLCVVIIYLSEPFKYEDRLGGKLKVTTSYGERFEVSPVLGNYCILDFSENNIDHEVEIVSGDFKRYAYTRFIESTDFIEYLNPGKRKLLFHENLENINKGIIREKESQLSDANKQLSAARNEILNLKKNIVSLKELIRDFKSKTNGGNNSLI